MFKFFKVAYLWLRNIDTNWSTREETRHALNIKWQHRVTNKDLYGNLPPASEILRTRWFRFARHCYRAEQECINRVFFSQHAHEKWRKGLWPTTTYLNGPVSDTGLNIQEVPVAMRERNVRRRIFGELLQQLQLQLRWWWWQAGMNCDLMGFISQNIP